jgi:hypothetical protein
MEDSPAFEKHPVERFLDARLPAAFDAELRQTLFGQTTRVLRRRRRWKRIGFVAALVGCYLLGMMTMQLGRATQPAATATARDLPEEPVAARSKVAQGMASTPGPVQAALPLNRDTEIPAFVLERMAQSCEENRSGLYRRAGDHYLADGDLMSALHCYSRSLDAGSENDRVVSKDDNWLLIHLKTARQEVKFHAKSAG